MLLLRNCLIDGQSNILFIVLILLMVAVICGVLPPTVAFQKAEADEAMPADE